MKWWDWMLWSLFFWKLSFKPAFSLSSLTFIERLFSSSFLSAIRVVSSGCLRLLIFLLAILIPACASTSPAFHMRYSEFMLNKQCGNIQLWHTPFPVFNQSVVPCPVPTVASWPAYRFLRRKVRWVWYSPLFKKGWHGVLRRDDMVSRYKGVTWFHCWVFRAVSCLRLCPKENFVCKGV